ncbi:MAG: Crp/Fnr family transcriptional regulator [Prevotella sp.]|nr:Crp/Fnr family transcriptional regulator [Prevotella sp.]
MATLQIYEKLLLFPLFQGMSRDDLEQVAGHTRFGFSKINAGSTVVTEGDDCRQLYFMINGSLRVETIADDRGYTVEEQLEAPVILQPEVVFGYTQRYTHTYIVQTDANFITVGKDEVLRLSEDFLVFRLNLLNMFATQTQKTSRLLWQHVPDSLEDRIVRFFAQRCLYPAGPKVFHILMNRLADELNDSRLNVSRALNRLKREGKIVLRRGRVEIPLMERLLM